MKDIDWCALYLLPTINVKPLIDWLRRCEFYSKLVVLCVYIELKILHEFRYPVI